MRILITGSTGESMPPPYGGIPKVSLLYAKAWKKMGHDVGITFTYRPPHADDLGADATYYFEYSNRPDRFKKTLFFLYWTFRKPFLCATLFYSYFKIYPRIEVESLLYAAYGVWLDTVIEKYNPEVILCEAALIRTFMALQIGMRRDIPVVIDSYAEVRDLSMGVNAKLKPKARRRYWKEFLSKADLILGMGNCSDGPRSYVPERVVEFYDTADFSFLENATETQSQARRALGLPAGFLAGAVGTFNGRKGHEILVEAVSELIHDTHGVHIAICGSGDPTSLLQLASERGIQDRVYIFQVLSEQQLALLYRSLDLYCNLSNSDRSCGLDLALIEGMAAGKPIMVSDTGALPSAVPNSSNGFIVKTNDTAAVTSVLRTCARMSEGDLQALGAESRRLAKKYDITETSRIKLEFLQNAIKKHHFV